MDVQGKRYIRNESASCTQIVEENAANSTKRCSDPHEKLRAMLNNPDDDSDELLPPSDAPKFGTVIHNRIFVGGFSLTTTDEDLWKFFSTFAAVTAARVIYDRAGISKCYGFVTFASPRHARLIVKQSGGVMFSPLGRLRVAQAVRKQSSQMAISSGECPPPPLCYQLLCAPGPFAPPYPPCEVQPYTLYPIPYDGTTLGGNAMYAPTPAPTGQYTLVPAYGAGCPCEPACCQPIDKGQTAPLHPAFIY